MQRISFLKKSNKICQNDIAENHSKTLVLKKNQNLPLKKKENLNAKSEKVRIKLKLIDLFKQYTSFFKFPKAIKYV